VGLVRPLVLAAEPSLTQHFAEVLEDNGLIEERTDRWSIRSMTGASCPTAMSRGPVRSAAMTPARGDQCDNCGSAAGSDGPDRSLFGDLRLARHRGARDPPPLSAADQAGGADPRLGRRKADWPALPRSIAYKHLDEGLIDRGITRDLAWGVPVTRGGLPRPGFEDKVFYVWFDAPIEYIAATQEWADARPAPRDWRALVAHRRGGRRRPLCGVHGQGQCRLPHGQLPRHPLGSGEPWKMVDTLKAFNWLNWYGGKFSTSQKRGVFMDQALELLPPDYWRWYLTANARKAPTPPSPGSSSSRR
jgi:methionyl-tRNA synthetase